MAQSIDDIVRQHLGDLLLANAQLQFSLQAANERIKKYEQEEKDRNQAMVAYDGPKLVKGPKLIKPVEVTAEPLDVEKS